MDSSKLQRNIDYGSILPIIVFISGFLSIYFFSANLFGEGMITMIFSSVLFLAAVIIRDSDINSPSQFNLILENLSSFVAFAIAPVVFGVKFYAETLSLFFTMFIYFFAIGCILSVARNWDYDVTESVGMPIAFNGILFPLFYYIYKFYFQSPGSSIFLIYFLFAGILIISNYKFIQIQSRSSAQKVNVLSRQEIEDKITLERIKRREEREFERYKLEKRENVPKRDEVAEVLAGQGVKKFNEDIIEESILEKIQKKFRKIIPIKDDFNTISGMPSQKELDEILPHRLEKKDDEFKSVNSAFDIKPKENKRRKTLFQKLIGFVYSKFEGDKHFNDISGIPSRKEVEETLIDNTNIVSEKQVERVNYEKRENVPSRQELEETLPKSDFDKDDDIDLVGGDNKIEPVKSVSSFNDNSDKKFKNLPKEKEVFGNSYVSNDKENLVDDLGVEDFDENELIDFDDSKLNGVDNSNLVNKVSNVSDVELNNDNSLSADVDEEFDLGEFENDYVEKK